MKKDLANEIVGGLSRTSKLPFWSYGLSAFDCKTGSKLAKIKGTPCNRCYARQGSYIRYPNVAKSHKKRKEALSHPQWESAMVSLLEKQSYFRWFDSGDIQNDAHFIKILKVTNSLPDCKFWLPTQEREIVEKYKSLIPDNIAVRISQAKVNQIPPKRNTNEPLALSSMVYTKDKADSLPPHVFKCLSPLQDNTCKNCRACFDKTVQCVGYLSHGRELPMVNRSI